MKGVRTRHEDGNTCSTKYLGPNKDPDSYPRQRRETDLTYTHRLLRWSFFSHIISVSYITHERHMGSNESGKGGMWEFIRYYKG